MQTVIAGRALIINDKNELLLVTHKGEDFWYTPGGRWHPDESLIDCAKREVYEEIGIKVEFEKLVYINEFISDHRGESLHFIAFHFYGKTNQSLPENWEDTSGDAPIIAKFLSHDDLRRQEKVYPDFLKNDFWKDLDQGFQNHQIYKNSVNK